MSANPVIVTGDGTEMPTGEEQLQKFENVSNRSNTTTGSDTDEVTPSFIRSPAWNHKFHLGNSMDHAEDEGATLEQLPDISVSPSKSREPEYHRLRPILRRRNSSHSLLNVLPRSCTQGAHSGRTIRTRKSHGVLRPAVLGMTSSFNPPRLPLDSQKSSSHPDLTVLVKSWSASVNQAIAYPTNAAYLNH
jgi:hypothetical protein